MFSRKERNVDPASRDHDAVVNIISSHRGEGFFSVQRTFNVSFLRVAKGDVQVDRQFRRNETVVSRCEKMTEILRSPTFERRVSDGLLRDCVDL